MNRIAARSLLVIGLTLLVNGPLRADTTNCTVLNPPTPISENSAVPTVDVISVTTSETITDVDVSVNISHDFIDDLRVSIVSPAGTSVQLHNMAGTADFIIATFDDQGVGYGTVDFDSGCAMQPAGPGTLGDFSGENTQGDWTLQCLDTFPGGATGFLAEWCLITFDQSTSTPVLPVANVLCTSAGGSGVANLAWSNTQPYTSINIYLDGGLIDTLPGTATSYTTPLQAFGIPIELGIEPLVGIQTPCVPTTCALTPQMTPADVDVCSLAAAVVSNTLPPTVDVITIPNNTTLADLQVQVDISHPFIGDLYVDLAHTGTQIRLHDANGGAGTRIQVSYWDVAAPNGQGGFDGGSLTQPSGPGTLSEYFGSSTQGDWTLTVDDFWTGPANFGRLNFWCVRGYETGTVNQLVCDAPSGSDTASLTWSNPQVFDSINVILNGNLEATLPGNATSYITPSQLIPSTLEICLEPVLGGVPLPQNCCTVDFLVEPMTIDSCSSDSGSGTATVSWTNPTTYDQIVVIVNGVPEVSLPGTATSYTLIPVALGSLPTTAEICLEASQGAAFSTQVCCNVALLDTVDIENCRLPGVPVNSSVSPVTDILIMPSNLLIGEAEVLIDITHDFVGDLIIDLTGPNGAQVRLHDELGNQDDNLVVLFTDTGIPNAAPYDCGCAMQPTGPGALDDFRNIPSIGAWVLQIEDTFNGNIGFLNKWCVRVRAGCQILPPTDLTVTSNGSDVFLQWNNPSVYDSVDVERDGVVVASLPGTAVNYVDNSATPGVHDYEIFGIDNALGCSSSEQPRQGGVGITDLIYDGDLGGNVDSPQEIANRLTIEGRVPMVIESFDDEGISSAGPFEVLWICLGTFPAKSQLTAAEAQLLAELHTGDEGLDGTIESPPMPVYLESADFWAFDPPNVFEDYDGIENASFGNLQNGNNSLTDLVGVNSGVGLDLGLFNGVYAQDAGGNDFTDRLAPCDQNPDLGGAAAGVIWTGDEMGNVYNVGVYYASTVAPVISQSWEFGGFTAAPSLLMQEYITGLTQVINPPVGSFVRGDVNNDSSVNVADAVFFLNALFVPGSDQPTCLHSGDVNDDEGANVADAIYLLNALFVPGADLVPPPNAVTGCGADPTPGALSCVLNACP